MSSELDKKVKTALNETRLLILGAQVLLGFQFQAFFQDRFLELSILSKHLCLFGLASVILAIRGGDLAARASGLKHVFTLGPTNYGVDLLAAADDAGTASPRCLAGPDDIATLNYTGGTTGKSKGALRTHREYGGVANASRAHLVI